MNSELRKFKQSIQNPSESALNKYQNSEKFSALLSSLIEEDLDDLTKNTLYFTKVYTLVSKTILQDYQNGKEKEERQLKLKIDKSSIDILISILVKQNAY